MVDGGSTDGTIKIIEKYIIFGNIVAPYLLKRPRKKPVKRTPETEDSFSAYKESIKIIQKEVAAFSVKI